MPPVEPITRNALGLDLSGRFFFTTTVVASPAAAAETIIAQLAAIPSNITAVTGVDLSGWAAYTVGTSGTAVRFRIRQTNVAGTVVGDTGALTGSQHGAAILSADDCEGFDAAPTLPGQVYVLTMQVTAGAAASTVSATKLRAIIV
jgi:hypothetical protein